MEEQATRIAAATGLHTDAVRDLALEASNVTFPLQEALDLMESGRQQGLRSGEQLQEFATFWDMVGDATGEVGPELGKAGVALRAVGIAAGEEGEALGAFGFISQETTGSVKDFLKFLERTGPELNTMGADVNDAAAILGILESELGMSGRTARTEFRSAVSEADGDLGAMLETLGISEDQFDTYRQAVEGSSGVIERNAAIHADSFTPVQRLSHAIEELMFKHGALFDIAGKLALPLLALGPISKGVSGGLKGMVKVAKGVPRVFGLIGKGTGKMASGLGRMAASAARAGVQVATTFARMAAQAAMATGRVVAQIAIQIARWTVLGVQALIHAAKVALAWLISLGPIAIVGLAVIALVALIIANWDKVVTFTKAAFGAVTGAVSSAFEWVKRNWPLLLAILTGPIGLAVLAIVKHWGTIRDGVTAVKDWIVARFNDVVSFVTGLPGRIAAAASGMWDGITSAFKAAINSIIRLWNGLTFPSVTVGGGDPLGPFGPSLPSVTIGGWDLPNIPELAEGGIIKARPGGTLFRGGEAGQDEAVVPLPRGISRMGDGGARVENHWHIAGSIRSDRDLIRLFRDELDRGGLDGVLA
jgi:hypothetical protein